MKRINYTGTSKLISRIVHLLNRKAPLPLNGDGDAVWGTNGQVLTTDGQGNTYWGDGGGGGDVTDVEVNGTSVVNAQGVAEVSVPTNTSDLTNDSGFITNLVNDLANYYTKSQTYTQAEVNALISGIVTLNILVVQTLPTQDISTTTIYLVPKQDAGTDDIYDEYLYINNAWELIGTTQIDLSNYVTTTDLSTALADYVTSVGLATILAGYVQSSDLAAVATSGNYSDLSGTPDLSNVAYKNINNYFSSYQTINTKNGTAGTVGESTLVLGNSTSSGTAENSKGVLWIYGEKDRYTRVETLASTGNRTVSIPDANGTLALQEINNNFSANQTIDRANGTTTTIGESYLHLGNNIPSGTAGNTRGVITLYGDSGNRTLLSAKDSSATRSINFPDKDGTIALIEETIKVVSSANAAANTTTRFATENSILYILITHQPYYAHHGLYYLTRWGSGVGRVNYFFDDSKITVSFDTATNELVVVTGDQPSFLTLLKVAKTS